MKKLYSYTGPVLKFDVVVARNWHGSTWAASEKQAASNLAYQYKKQAGLIPATKVSLAGTPVAM